MAAICSIRARHFIVLCGLLSAGVTAAARAQEETTTTEGLIDKDGYAAAYAAVINFAVNPEIAVAKYNIKTDSPTSSDQILDVYRLPARYDFTFDGSDSRYFLQLEGFYQTLVYKDNWGADELIKPTWTAAGGAAAMGVEIPLNEHLKFLPSAAIGISRLENETTFNGFLGQELLRPILDDAGFTNWWAEARVIGLSSALDYQRNFEGVDLSVKAVAHYNNVRSYRASNNFEHFNSDAMTLDVGIEAKFPTRVTVGDYPMAFILDAGATSFVGPDRNALDFSAFAEAGFAFEFDLSKGDYWVDNFRIGALGITGENVVGWTIVLSYNH